MLRPAAASLALLAVATPALACPVCNSETGGIVRAAIFNADFLPTLASTLAPFPVLLALVAALRFGWAPDRPLRRRGAAREGSRS